MGKIPTFSRFFWGERPLVRFVKIFRFIFSEQHVEGRSLCIVRIEVVEEEEEKEVEEQEEREVEQGVRKSALSLSLGRNLTFSAICQEVYSNLRAHGMPISRCNQD